VQDDGNFVVSGWREGVKKEKEEESWKTWATRREGTVASNHFLVPQPLPKKPHPPSCLPQVYSHDPDGNEIVTFATGTDADPGATSSSSDFKKPGSRLVMQRDHDLVLLSDSGEVVWRTNTVGKGMGGGETVYAALDDGGVLHGE